MAGVRVKTRMSGRALHCLDELARALAQRGAGAVGGGTVLEGASEPRPRFEQDHPQTRLRRGEGGGHPGRTAAHHADFGVEVNLVEAPAHAEIRREVPDAGSPPDLLDSRRPKARGSMENPVVEPGRHGPAQAVHDPQQIELRAALDVLRPDRHARRKRRQLGAHVGHPVHVHEGVGGFPVQAVESPGPVVLEAAAEHPDAVGVHGGCQRVPGEPPERFPAIAERDHPFRIDVQRRQVLQPGHFSASSAEEGTSRLRTVSRQMVNHVPHPRRWYHHSF